MAIRLTQERLCQVLDYNPDTGVFCRLETHSNNPMAAVGRPIMGARNSRYIYIRIDGRRYAAHQLAWLYVHNVAPSHDLDHINGDGKDNRISNLRQATRSENMRNISVPRHNKSGVKGVCWDKLNKRWMAYIQIDGKCSNLGRFERIEDAQAAYNSAAISKFGEFARLSPPVISVSDPGTTNPNHNATQSPACRTEEPQGSPLLRPARIPDAAAYPF